MRAHSPLPGTRLLPALVAALASACSRPAPAPAPATSSTPAAVPGPDTLVVATMTDAQSLIGPVAQSALETALGEQVFLALTGGEFDCRPVFTPALAESWESSPDGTGVTFRLRPGLRWSDGRPVTARDVAFTYDLIADPKVASPRITFVAGMKPDGRPRVLDDRTVRFEFNRPYDLATRLTYASSNLVPEHAVSRCDRSSLRGCDFNRDPVVSGPWKLGRHEPNAVVELIPNPAYAGPDPAKLGRVVVKVLPDYATRLAELENGTVDMLDPGFQNVEDIARIRRSHPEYRMYSRGLRFLDFVGWNTTNPLFADREVRRALTMAIDRGRIVRDLLTTADGDVYGREAVSWITPELCDYRSEAIAPLPFDPARSREVLAARGWRDSDGDGLLDRGARPFRFRLVTNAANPRRAKIQVLVQADLKAVGIDVQLEQLETNAFFERLRKRDFEAMVSGWHAGLYVDPAETWHSDAPGRRYEFNFTGYSNPRADDLMDRAAASADPEQAAALVRELQKVVYDDQPYTFLYWRQDVLPLHERFQGAKIDLYSSLHDLNRWWVPADRVKYRPR